MKAEDIRYQGHKQSCEDDTDWFSRQSCGSKPDVDLKKVSKRLFTLPEQ